VQIYKIFLRKHSSGAEKFNFSPVLLLIIIITFLISDDLSH